MIAEEIVEKSELPDCKVGTFHIFATLTFEFIFIHL